MTFDGNLVCLHHKRHVPCRPCLRLQTSGEDFIDEWTNDEEAIRIVSEYQRSKDNGQS
jgi:hypothetical protein